MWSIYLCLILFSYFPMKVLLNLMFVKITSDASTINMNFYPRIAHEKLLLFNNSWIHENMIPAVNKQCRDCLENFWKNCLILHLNILIHSVKFSRSFSALPVSIQDRITSLYLLLHPLSMFLWKKKLSSRNTMKIKLSSLMN